MVFMRTAAKWLIHFTTGLGFTELLQCYFLPFQIGHHNTLCLLFKKLQYILYILDISLHEIIINEWLLFKFPYNKRLRCLISGMPPN